jgi:MFS family permease
VNRKKLLCVINLWLAAGAFGLAVFGWLNLLSPDLILLCVFIIGAGFAFNAPTWTSVVAQVVPERDLASVATLNGLQFNISGIIGPALGGLLLPIVGANLIFAANAVSFLLIILAQFTWKQCSSGSGQAIQKRTCNPTVAGCDSDGVQYLRSTPRLQSILVRNFEFSLFISAIPAVVPIIGLKVFHFNSSDLGLLFTSLGAGSVVAALFILPWVRQHFSGNALTFSSSVVVVVYILMASIDQRAFFFPAAALAGVSGRAGGEPLCRLAALSDV